MKKTTISRSKALELLGSQYQDMNGKTCFVLSSEKMVRLGIKTRNYFGRKIVVTHVNESIFLHFEVQIGTVRLGKSGSQWYVRH